LNVFGSFKQINDDDEICDVNTEDQRTAVKYTTHCGENNGIRRENDLSELNVKVKVGLLYSAAYAMTGPARFTISEVAVDLQEPMVLQRKLRPSNCTR